MLMIFVLIGNLIGVSAAVWVGLNTGSLAIAIATFTVAGSVGVLAVAVAYCIATGQCSHNARSRFIPAE